MSDGGLTKFSPDGGPPQSPQEKTLKRFDWVILFEIDTSPVENFFLYLCYGYMVTNGTAPSNSHKKDQTVC